MRDEIQRAGIVEDAAADTTGRPQPPRALSSPWFTAEEAAERARCGVKVIYREVRAGRLRAARIGGRRELRFLPEWIDEWLIAGLGVRGVHGSTEAFGRMLRLVQTGNLQTYTFLFALGVAVVLFIVLMP